MMGKGRRTDNYDTAKVNNCNAAQSQGVDLTNLCPDVCVKDAETDPFRGKSEI